MERRKNPIDHSSNNNTMSPRYGAIGDRLPTTPDNALLASHLPSALRNQPSSLGRNSSLGWATLQEPEEEAPAAFHRFGFQPAMDGFRNGSQNGYGFGNLGFSSSRSRNGSTCDGVANEQRMGVLFTSMDPYVNMMRRPYSDYSQRSGSALPQEARGCVGSRLPVYMRVGKDARQLGSIFSTLVDVNHLKDVMTHPTASKAFQTLVGRCSERSRVEMVVSLSLADVRLLQTVCCNPYGTNSMQQLLECLDTEDQRIFAMGALSTIAIALMIDVHGQHVIEFCLKNFSDKEKTPILLGIGKHFVEIASNKAGCDMLWKCIQLSRGLHREYLLTLTAVNSLQLALDPSGNFLVQNLLGLKIPLVTTYILKHLEGNYHLLSQDKYGSHVVQKCLMLSRGEQSKNIVLELMKGRYCTDLFFHPFGNYVVQSMIVVAERWEVVYVDLQKMIEANREWLQCDLYGSRVLSRLAIRRNIQKSKDGSKPPPRNAC